MSSPIVPDPQVFAPNALRARAATVPGAPCLRHADGRTLTYGEVLDAALRRAGVLRAAGVGEGEHVAYLLADPVETALVWLGVAFAGAVCVPVNTAYFGRMLVHVLHDSGAVAVVTDAGFEGVVAQVADELPDLRAVVVTGKDDAGDAAPVEPVDAEAHRTAALLYTSGTTGPSKGVVVPWAAMHGYWSWVPADTLGEGDCLYCPMTLFHISGIGALHYTLSRGGCFATRDRFSATAFWDDARAFGAVAAGLVGPMTAMLHAQPPRPDDADNPLRSIVLGPMIPGIAEFERRFAVRTATSYGMTEVPPLITTGWDHGPSHTCGRVHEGYPWAEVRLVDEHDVPVPLGVVGELVIRTSAPWTLNAGYHNNPEATARAWRNGWFHTGDAFRQDTEGRFVFTDRLKDAIRRRGENISSFEVEAFVLQCAAVGECAAFGVPDDLGGDDVMIAVVPAAEGLDPAALVAELAGRMPAYMVPRYVDVVAELPRNTTSLRVRKHELRARGVTETTWDRERKAR